MNRKTNHLAGATSPYLLQHVHNPVDWYPWCDESLEKARAENKMLLISIGYSACHWCHVMERECFEDEKVAEWMNAHFVCIKVDREERPDIDQVYMSAVQLLTGRGGWPLNCFALPDGRPVYGGTYFPKLQWIDLLSKISSMYANDQPRIMEYARQLTHGVASSDILQESTLPQFDQQLLLNAVEKWKAYMDQTDGGPDRAPKFPLPNNYRFLLRHAHVFGDEDLKSHVRLTLKKMAYGGIYDQVGGGFARYSVDGIWKVPHFEKMLYDNAQLISLYAEAWRSYSDPLYRDVVFQTIEFIERELTAMDGCFYSALDADSEGEEGLFYVWEKQELWDVLGADYNLASDYFNVNERGYWEDDRYILLRQDEDAVLAERHGIGLDELRSRISVIIEKLLNRRSNRPRPLLDHKILTSWNAMMITAYVDAGRAFGERRFTEKAILAMEVLGKKMLRDDGGLNHAFRNETEVINGYLEDYALFIQALISLYQVTFQYDYLLQAFRLADYVENHFRNEDSPMYYFTSDLDAPLFARKTELHDNVIPASNSQMAKNLHWLGFYSGEKRYSDRCRQMLGAVHTQLSGYGSSYSNWLDLWQRLSLPMKEVVLCGSGAVELREKLDSQAYLPYLYVDGCMDAERTDPVSGRLKGNENLVYICLDHVCGLPYNDINDAITLLRTG